MKRFERSKEDGTWCVICGRRLGRRLRRRLERRRRWRDREGERPWRRRRWRGRSSSSCRRRLGLASAGTDRPSRPRLVATLFRRLQLRLRRRRRLQLFSCPVKQPKTIRRPSLHHTSNTPGAGNTCGPVSTRLDIEGCWEGHNYSRSEHRTPYGRWRVDKLITCDVALALGAAKDPLYSYRATSYIAQSHEAFLLR